MARVVDKVDQAVTVFAAGEDANRQTPNRRGLVVEVGRDAADEVMITADLHGHRRNFERLLRIADLDANPRRHLIMQEVCHGGPSYPKSGGCMSHLLLEDIAGLKAKYGDRFHFILSNHELGEMTDYPIVKAGQMLNVMFYMGMQEMYGDRTFAVREAMVSFLWSCPLAVRIAGDVFVSHSLPERVDLKGFDAQILERPLNGRDMPDKEKIFAVVWGRDFRAENAAAFAKAVQARVLIHGHEPCREGYAVPNPHQIILDCHRDRLSYAILPLAEDLTHAGIVERIRLVG